ncbi:MAG: carboxypeptidase regulatory-like domain-containing protein, partial [Methanothrix sp.]
MARYYGTGQFNLPAQAAANVITHGGGNQSTNISTFGWSNATLTYTYDDVPCLSGRKFNNRTGEGLSGWTINVSNSTDSWEIKTIDTGLWQICNLTPGNYTVCEVLEPCCIQVKPEGCYNVILANKSISNLDFYNEGTLCISGYKLDDCDGSGLEGWEVTLTNPSGIVGQTTTNASGYYEFCGLIPGAYTVTETVKKGWNPVTPPVLHLDLNCTKCNLTNQNFSNIQELCISGYKLNDCNNTGIPGW